MKNVRSARKNQNTVSGECTVCTFCVEGSCINRRPCINGEFLNDNVKTQPEKDIQNNSKSKSR